MRLHYKKNKNVLIHTMSFIKFWKKEVMLPHPVQIHFYYVGYAFNPIDINSLGEIWEESETDHPVFSFTAITNYKLNSWHDASCVIHLQQFVLNNNFLQRCLFILDKNVKMSE